MLEYLASKLYNAKVPPSPEHQHISKYSKGMSTCMDILKVATDSDKRGVGNHGVQICLPSSSAARTMNMYLTETMSVNVHMIIDSAPTRSS
jgi:hypothetical protein